MKLSNEQIGNIRQRLEEANFTLSTLEDDVFDHVCCVVEERLDKGDDFDVALVKALEDAAPQGLNALQFETNVLLNFNFTIRMKKLTFAIGLASSMMMGIGATMNILNLAGAGNLSSIGVGTVGFLGFTFLYLPLLAFTNFKRVFRDQPWFEKTKLIVGCLSGIILAIAVAFKILHWPGAEQLMLTGAVLLTFGFLPFVFFSLYRKSWSEA